MSLASKIAERDLIQQKTSTLNPSHPDYVKLLGQYLCQLNVLENEIKNLKKTAVSASLPSSHPPPISAPLESSRMTPQSQLDVYNTKENTGFSNSNQHKLTPAYPDNSLAYSSLSNNHITSKNVPEQQNLTFHNPSNGVNSLPAESTFNSSLFLNKSNPASNPINAPVLSTPSHAQPQPSSIFQSTKQPFPPSPNIKIQSQNSFDQNYTKPIIQLKNATNNTSSNNKTGTLPVEIVELDSDDETISNNINPSQATFNNVSTTVLGKRSDYGSDSTLIDLTKDDGPTQINDATNSNKKIKPDPAPIGGQALLNLREQSFKQNIYPRLNNHQKFFVDKAIQKLVSEKEKFSNWYENTTSQWKQIQLNIDNLTSSASDVSQKAYFVTNSKILWDKKSLYSRFKEMVINELIKIYSKRMINYKEYYVKLEDSINRMNEAARNSSNRLLEKSSAPVSNTNTNTFGTTESSGHLQKYSSIPNQQISVPTNSSSNSLENASRRSSLFERDDSSANLPTLSGVADLDRKELEKLINEMIYEDDDVRPEDRIGTPQCLASTLYEHQKICLKWLVNKENSLHGGILADDMGLGKTLQIISLVMTHPSDNPQRKTTLVIAPIALLQQWEKEFEKHVVPDQRLSIYVHHGLSRKNYTFEQLNQFDVVITSYGVIMNEHKEHFTKVQNRANPHQEKIAGNSPFFQNQSQWYRIILDEAHRIKNAKTGTAISCTALQAEYRWCLSGTPMQNNVNELQSLIRFLRIKPYDDPRFFSAHIGKPLEKGLKKNGQEALKKLRYLLKSIMLRRTKNTLIDNKPILQLPPKTVTMDCYSFDSDEKEYYEYLENGAIIRMNKYLSDNSIKKNYSSILVLLLRLRQACDHPKIVERAYLIKDKELLTSRTNASAVRCARKLNQLVVQRIKQETAFQCPMCMDACDRSDVVLISPCGHHICSDCCTESFQTSSDEVQNSFRCPSCNISISEKSFFDFIVFKWVYVQNLSDSQIASHRKMYRSQNPEEKSQLAAVDSSQIYSSVSQNEKIIYPESNDASDISSNSESDDDEDIFALSTSHKQKVQTKYPENKPEVSKNVKSKLKTEPPIVKSDPETPDVKLSSKNRYTKQIKGEEHQKNIGPLVTHSELQPLFPGGWISSTKITKCIELIRKIRLQYPGQKILIFSQFMSMLDFLEVALDLESENIVYGRYDGSMSSELRAKTIDDFTWKPDPSVLLISLKAGNVGLTLTAACHVIIMDPFWNPFVEEQAMDRAYRIGQKFPVNVHRLIIANSVEDRILKLQEKKRDLIDAALDEKQMKGMSRLDERELLYLFGLNERGQRTQNLEIPR